MHDCRSLPLARDRRRGCSFCSACRRQDLFPYALGTAAVADVAEATLQAVSIAVRTVLEDEVDGFSPQT